MEKINLSACRNAEKEEVCSQAQARLWTRISPEGAGETEEEKSLFLRETIESISRKMSQWNFDIETTSNEVVNYRNDPNRDWEYRVSYLGDLCSGNSLGCCISLSFEVKSGKISDPLLDISESSSFTEDDSTSVRRTTIERSASFVEELYEEVCNLLVPPYSRDDQPGRQIWYTGDHVPPRTW